MVDEVRVLRLLRSISDDLSVLQRESGAVLNGLPPHIAQVIAGHRDINVTMGYKAVYPDEAIEAHRAFIARRRATRPSEEYRTPPIPSGTRSSLTSKSARCPWAPAPVLSGRPASTSTHVSGARS